MSDLRTILLPAGNVLFHGTDAFEEFDLPRGAAWFAWTWTDAALWAGWGSKARGQRRVIEVEVRADIVLLDTGKAADGHRRCERLCGDSDATPWGAATAVGSLGFNGWKGNTEVLIVEPASALAFRSLSRVPDSIIPHGRPRASKTGAVS